MCVECGTTCIGHQLALQALALLLKLATKIIVLLALLPWIALLALILSVSIELVSSFARVTSVNPIRTGDFGSYMTPLMKVGQIGPTFVVPGKTVIFWRVKSVVSFSTLKMRKSKKKLAPVYAYTHVYARKCDGQIGLSSSCDKSDAV